MNFHLFDLAGFIGVLLIVVAYLLLQLDKLPSSSPRLLRQTSKMKYWEIIADMTQQSRLELGLRLSD